MTGKGCAARPLLRSRAHPLSIRHLARTRFGNAAHMSQFVLKLLLGKPRWRRCRSLGLPRRDLLNTSHRWSPPPNRAFCSLPHSTISCDRLSHNITFILIVLCRYLCRALSYTSSSHNHVRLLVSCGAPSGMSRGSYEKYTAVLPG